MASVFPDKELKRQGYRKFTAALADFRPPARSSLFPCPLLQTENVNQPPDGEVFDANPDELGRDGN